MKIEDIYIPVYREIAKYIEDNDIYDYQKFCIWCGENNDEWWRVLHSYKGGRFFYKWFFYKNMDRRRREERKRRKEEKNNADVL